MNRPLRNLGAQLMVLGVTAACSETVEPQVAQGVARLTIRNIGAITQLINDDGICGFRSPDAVGSLVVEGAPGAQGTATWSVENCRLELGSMARAKEDCLGTRTRALGTVTVSATRTLTGIVTGDPTRPVLPTDANAVTLHVTAILEDFAATHSNDENVLTGLSGKVSFDATPRLARSATHGLCSVPTPNVIFSNVVYEDAQLHLHADGAGPLATPLALDVTVGSSNLYAVAGRHGDEENLLRGTLELSGKQVHIPVPDESALDPSYNADQYVESYACTPDLTSVDAECDNPQVALGEGAARLNVRSLGAVLAAIQDDVGCGFSSAAAAGTTQLSGPAGSTGTATTTVRDCEINLVESVVSTDCAGVATRASGRIRVNGTRSIRGLLTGDGAQPVVPDSPDAVAFNLQVTMTDFTVRADNNPAVLTVKSGSVAFEAQPLLATSASTGVCSVPVPVVRFPAIRLGPSQFHVVAEQGAFDLSVESSNYQAQVGRGLGAENALAGTIRVAGHDVDLSGLVLDPAYNAAAYEGTWACTNDLAQPIRHECGNVTNQLGNGVARLTMRTLGAVAKLVEDDAACGFASSAVSVQVSGQPGGEGSAVFTVADCALNLDDTVVETDCNGVRTVANGQVVVSATRTVRGMLAGQGSQPVIPNASDVVDVDLDIRFVDFSVTVDGSPHVLTLHGGNLSAHLQPTLAVSAVEGVCAVPLPLVKFSAVRYANARATVVTPDATVTLDLPASELAAVAGRYGNEENALSGTIRIFGQDVVAGSDGDGLDPSYNASSYGASYACNPKLTNPIRTDCPDLRPVLAQGAARLGVKTYATVLKLLDKDTRCGFASASVKQGASVTGVLGEAGATAVSTLGNCVLEFPVEQAVETDCAGVSTFVQGKVTVSGTRTLRGIRTGSVDTPIVPTSWEPVDFNLDMVMDHFTVRSSDVDKALTVNAGRISGAFKPRTALDSATGACSIPTANVQFGNVQFHDADLTIHAGAHALSITVPTATLQGQAGVRDDVENTLTGTLKMGEELFTIPVDPADAGLVPGYDAEAFAQSYLCTPNLVMPVDNAQCSFMDKLGQGAARLLVRALGETTELVNEDDDCGFMAMDVLMDPDHVTGDPGDLGSMTFSFNNCSRGVSPSHPNGDALNRPVDCVGRRRDVSGRVITTAQRTVTGLRDTQLFFFDSIIPRSRDAVTVNMQEVTFDEYRNGGITPDGTPEPYAIRIHSGSISATAKPVLGENRNNPGTFDVKTPVARVENLRTTTGLEATLEAQGMVFRLHITALEVDAFNGSYQGSTNEISGTIVVNGVTVNLTGPLVENYDQDAFDDAYVCTPNLRAVVPSH
ncbi:MAG: hypothetical protein AB2A00_04205 [Myxococcota bacterium]